MKPCQAVFFDKKNTLTCRWQVRVCGDKTLRVEPLSPRRRRGSASTTVIVMVSPTRALLICDEGIEEFSARQREQFGFPKR